VTMRVRCHTCRPLEGIAVFNKIVISVLTDAPVVVMANTFVLLWSWLTLSKTVARVSGDLDSMWYFDRAGFLNLGC